MTVPIAREVALKLTRKEGGVFFEEILLTVNDCECNTPTVMANQRHPDKTILTVWIPRTMDARLRKAAKSRKETLTELVTSLITNATSTIQLTPEDYRRIADETEKATQRLSAKGAGRPASQTRGNSEKKPG